MTLKNYSHQNLAGTDFSGVDLSEADLSYSNLQGANFGIALLQDANLAYADMTGVNLGETRAFYRVVISPDGQRLASVYRDDNLIHLWDTASGREINVLRGHTSTINDLAFSPKGDLLASASNDGSVRLWEMSSGHEVHVLTHQAPVQCVAFSSEDGILASGGYAWVGEKPTVWLWDGKRGKKIRPPRRHSQQVSAVAFSPDGRLLASGGEDGSVRLCEAKSGKKVWTKTNFPEAIRSLAFDFYGQQIWALSTNLIVLDVTTGEMTLALQGQPQPTALAVLNQDQVAIAVEKGVVEVWKFGNLKKVLGTKIHKDTIHHLSFQATSSLLASASEDKAIGLLHIETGESRLIKQELHCLRANIFGMRGMREDQKAWMMRKGAIEIDPQELAQKQQKSLREILRRKRVQALAKKIKESQKREQASVVLILGPCTFLPSLETIEREDNDELLRLLRFVFPRFFQEEERWNLRETWQSINELYEEMSPNFISRFSPKKDRSPFLVEQYNALVSLINKGFFRIVLDLDIFSPLEKEMFSSMSDIRYTDTESMMAFSISQSFSKEWRYVEKGKTWFVKFFGEEGRLSFKKYGERFPFGFERLLDSIFYEMKEDTLTLWTGFPLSRRPLFFRFPERKGVEKFYWVMDESIREEEGGQRSVTCLDYPLERLTDVFHDLYTELYEGSFSEDYNTTQLYRMAYSENIEERSRAARELVNLMVSRKSNSQDLLNSVKILGSDTVLKVRQSAVLSFLENFSKLPSELSQKIPDFAHDSEDTIRADVAKWIIIQYDEVGKDYDSLLLELMQDKSSFVRQVIVDNVKERFERLPSHIRTRLSQLVGGQIEVQMMKGGGMLVGTFSDLALRVTNHAESLMSNVEIDIQPSAEYEVENRRVSMASLVPEKPEEVTFRLKMKVGKQVAVNYSVNGELKEPPLYINAIQDNPYVYGNAIQLDSGFFGRKAELEQIIQAVTKPIKQDILIVGERRTGKTSLIYQLKNRLQRPFIPVYVVLNTAEPQTEKILELVHHNILSSLVEQNLLSADWIGHSFSCSYFEENIREILKAAKTNLVDLRLVLFLDEADFLLKPEVMTPRGSQMDERVQNILRAALQSSKVGSDLRAVVAGTYSLSRYISQSNSPFFNHFRFVPLKPFSKEEIRDLIVKPASFLGYTYLSEAITRIIELSGGYPYYCQAICYEAFGNALKEGRPLIKIEDVNLAEEKRTEDMFDSYLSYFWNRTDETEKLFLCELSNGHSTNAFAKSQINRLVDWGIVLEREGKYHLAGGLIAKWTQMASKKG